MGSGETMDEILNKVAGNVTRAPAQTATHKKLPVYMPPSTQTTTQVYTRRPKKTPLGPINDGPFTITDRLGKSCLRLQVGHYANGQPREETRHWRSCYPADVAEDTAPASRPALGRRKSKNT